MCAAFGAQRRPHGFPAIVRADFFFPPLTHGGHCEALGSKIALTGVCIAGPQDIGISRTSISRGRLLAAGRMELDRSTKAAGRVTLSPSRAPLPDFAEAIQDGGGLR